MPLYSQFESFWKYALDRFQRNLFPEPLLHVAGNWEFWKKAKLSPDQASCLETSIRSLGAEDQQGFVERIEHWGRKQDRTFPSSVGWIVLHQLSRVPEFAGWQALDCYRLDSLRGVKAVLLRDPQSPAASDVRPIRVVLLKQGSGGWGYHPLNAKFDAGGLADVQRSLTSCLGGLSFPVFALSWAIFGSGRRFSAARLCAALCAGIALLTSAAVVLGSSPLSRSPLHTSLWIVVAAVGVLLATTLGALIREWSRARRQLNRLNGARAVVVLGGGSWTHVEDLSFGVALHLSTLLALYRDVPTGDSALSRCAQIVRERLDVSAFTGKLTSSGRVQPVGWIPEKITACELLDKEFTLFIPPRRTPPRRTGTGRSSLNTRRLWPSLPLPIAALGLRAREYLAAGGVLLASGVLALACFDAWRTLDPPEAPRVLIDRSGFQRDQKTMKDVLRMSFMTPSSPRFGVRLNSRYWANREGRIPMDSSGISKVDLHMDRLQQPTVWDEYDGDLEVVYFPSFLERPLRSVVVEKMLLERVVVPRWEIGFLGRR